MMDHVTLQKYFLTSEVNSNELPFDRVNQFRSGAAGESLEKPVYIEKASRIFTPRPPQGVHVFARPPVRRAGASGFATSARDADPRPVGAMTSLDSRREILPETHPVRH